MKKVAFSTLGCKLNFAESSEIARRLEQLGYQRAGKDEIPDAVVLNTCTVTELANKKSKQAIKKYIKENPDTFIAVVGCYSQLKPDEVANIEGVDLVLGTDNKFDVIEHLKDCTKNKQTVYINKEIKDFSFSPSYSFGDRTRSFLKVQDGCNYYCSYCTIPKARGVSRSATIEQSVATAKEIVAQGVKEIILTGVNIGDFGKQHNERFIDLVKALDQIEGLERLRISSIEPNLLTEEVIDFVANSKVIVPHFHIPLQCGTDHLLRLMRRRYTTQLYAGRVAYIKSKMPDACIAADLIVGVPGETMEEHEKTMDFIRSIDISYLHVFTYSEREDTLAANMKDQVPVGERKERSKTMHSLSEEKLLAFKQSQLGKERSVLFELASDQEYMYGFTDNYLRVQCPVNTDFINKTKKVKLTEILENGNILGTIV